MAEKPSEHPEINDVWGSLRRIEEGPKKVKEDLIRMSEISLILDTYDDIFSDFDPRPYSVRALSEDFLFEAKRGSTSKVIGEVDLILMVPKHLRVKKQESIITKRLVYYFKDQYAHLWKDIRTRKKKGFLLLFVGALIGGIATLIYPYHTTDFFAAFGVLLLEPTSWFTMWTGLEAIFRVSKQDQSDLLFYEKMSDCKISFLSY
jgi:hypothetical protein